MFQSIKNHLIFQVTYVYINFKHIKLSFKNTDYPTFILKVKFDFGIFRFKYLLGAHIE